MRGFADARGWRARGVRIAVILRCRMRRDYSARLSYLEGSLETGGHRQSRAPPLRPLSAVLIAACHLVLVQPLVEMQTLEDELNSGRAKRRASLPAELLDG